MKNLTYLFALLLILTSCKNEKESELDAEMASFDELTEQTIAVHDEVMPEMGHLMDLSMEIDETLKNADVSDAQSEELLDSQIQLENAHDAMMDWMKGYSTEFPYEAETPSTKEELDQKMMILEKSFENIKTVKSQTEEAIANAQHLLNEVE